MIYFCDEDVQQIKPFAFEMELRGYSISILEDADKAFIGLSKNMNIELAIIDVMYAVNVDKEKSRFSRSNTQDFTITGLTLLDDLIVVRPDIFPKRALFFSMGASDNLIRQIRAKSKIHQINFLRKSQFPTPYAFGERIVAILQRIAQIGSQL